MLIQKIQWWLWNQMFQYAFIKALALRNNSSFKLDISDYETYFRPYELEIFNIEKKYADKKDIPFYEKIEIKNRYLSYVNNVFIKPILRKTNINHHIERAWIFEKEFLHTKKWYFEWYFQNENYFQDYSKEIRKSFIFEKKLSGKNQNFLKKIEQKNTISVHIRRWDYLKYPDFHPICSKDYYNNSILYIYMRKSMIQFSYFFPMIPNELKKFLNENNQLNLYLLTGINEKIADKIWYWWANVNIT